MQDWDQGGVLKGGTDTKSDAMQAVGRPLLCMVSAI